MRAVVQRVTRASASPGGEIGQGLCVLLGIARDDDAAAACALAGKIARLRIFENDEGKFDRSLLDVGGAALVVSQFTLIANSTRAKGNSARLHGSRAAETRPSRSTSTFCDGLRDLGVHVETGVFGARMAVELVNDGPVTIILDVDWKPAGRSP